MNSKVFIGTGEKNILILTGVHGNELTPIYIGYKLSDEDYFFDLKHTFKTLTILNAINVNGIRQNVREIPSDFTTDLNRMFKTETKEEYVNIIKQYINDNDVVIDIHSSPNCAELLLINNDEYANSYVEFCEKFNITYLLRYSSNDTIKKYCINSGKIGFTLETNKMSSIDMNSVDNALYMINKMLRNLNNFEFKIEEPKYELAFEFFTHKEGMFIPDHKLGDIIETDEALGECINLFDFSISTIIYNKSFNSRILCSDDSSFINSNKSIYMMQSINKII